MPLAERIERHARALERGGRSPLYAELMHAAARSAATGGVVAEVFPDGAGPPGSVPALRLMAALHRLVLEGRATELASHFPSVGGSHGPGGAWPAAEAAIRRHLPEVRALVARTVQTNEPGRSAALYGALLWLAARHRQPVRLLEVGASAGLNLHVDRYGYEVGDLVLGDPDSPVRFSQPWIGAPVDDPEGAGAYLKISCRAGCDPAPVDVSSADGRLTALSYVWADEPARVARLRAAIEVARRQPVTVEAASAGPWLARRLAEAHPGALTVVWQSVVRQYLTEAEREEAEAELHAAGQRATEGAPLAAVALEPGDEHLSSFELTCRTWPERAEAVLAMSGDHGPPLRWRPDEVGRR